MNPFNAQVSTSIRDYTRVEEKHTRDKLKVKSAEFKARKKNHYSKSLNLYLIWLVVLKMLMLEWGNRSLKFEVFVNPSLAIEDGRFEMLCLSMSYFDSLKT